jgi:predicted methyltransferase
VIGAFKAISAIVTPPPSPSAASSVPEGNSRPNLAPLATPPAPPTAPRPSPVALADRDAKLHEAGIPAAPIAALSRPFEDPVSSDLASEQIDLVTLMFNYHDPGHLGVDRAAMNRAVFRALKPGGLYVIADHAGRPGTGISESVPCIGSQKPFFARKSKRQGFRLGEKGKFLRNPNDPRNKNTPSAVLSPSLSSRQRKAGASDNRQLEDAGRPPLMMFPLLVARAAPTPV